jgi:hypothetical protein
MYTADSLRETSVHSHWSVIDGLVREIGALAADVHMAERTLATDPRTRAARSALDVATEAVRAAIDDVTEAAQTEATRALAQAHAAVASLGLTAQTGRSLVSAARTLVDRAQRNPER